MWGKFGEVSAKKCEEVLPELQLVPGVPGRSIVPHQNHTIYHTSTEPYTIPHQNHTIPYLTISYYTIPEPCTPCKPPYLTRTIMPPYLTPNHTMVPYHYTILYHIILYHIILYHTIPHKNHTISHLFHTSAYMVPLVNIVLHFTHFPPLPPPAIPPSVCLSVIALLGHKPEDRRWSIKSEPVACRKLFWS